MDKTESFEADQEKHHDSEEQDKNKNPLFYIIALFMALLIVSISVPYYGIKINPEPKDVPLREEIIRFLETDDYLKPSGNLINDFRTFVIPEDTSIKKTADFIATQSCASGKLCYAKALYYFIRDNYKYVSDPISTEYIEDPKEFLYIGGGDCESGTIALASMMESIGINSEIVLIPGHAFLRIIIYEDDLPKKYRNTWIYLDWTCSSCGFGELPWQSWEQEFRFVDVP